MLRWGKEKEKQPEVFATVTDGLKRLYKQKLLPLEEYYNFNQFHSPALDDPDFDAKVRKKSDSDISWYFFTSGLRYVLTRHCHAAVVGSPLGYLIADAILFSQWCC